jgi:hypothetical protein
MMLCLSVTATPAFATEGSIGIRLIDIPESLVGDPRARLYVVDHLAPGTTISRRVEISNSTNAPIEVSAYASAATIDDGSFIGSQGRTANELSQWTTVAPEVHRIAANSISSAVVTVAVPIDAAPGEYYGVVWAETGSSADGVVLVNRVGIRMYISVGPGNPPAADFEISSFRASRLADGSPVVAATVVNTGGRALDISGSLTLTDGPGGLTAGPFDATLGVTLAIGSTEEVRVVLDPRVPDGPWTAEISLRSGLTERDGVAVIVFPTIGSSAPVTIETESSGDTLRLVAVAAVVVAFLLSVAALAMVLTRRQQARP